MKRGRGSISWATHATVAEQYFGNAEVAEAKSVHCGNIGTRNSILQRTYAPPQ